MVHFLFRPAVPKRDVEMPDRAGDEARWLVIVDGVENSPKDDGIQKSPKYDGHTSNGVESMFVRVSTDDRCGRRLLDERGI